jgi:hypothetical protein
MKKCMDYQPKDKPKKGKETFIKHIFSEKNQDGSKRQLSYADMRAIYG